MRTAVIKIAAVSVIAITILAWMVYKTTQIDPRQQERTVELLRELRQVDIEINEEALRSRLATNFSYDALTALYPKLRQLQQRLQSGRTSLAYGSNAEVDKALKTYIDSTTEKEDLVEEFKSHNSILRNSVNAMPIALGELSNLDIADETTLDNAFRLTKEALQFATVANANNQALIEILTDELNTAGDALDQRSAVLVGNLTAHANTVVREQALVDELLTELVQFQTPQTLSGLSASIDDLHVDQLQELGRYRTALAIYCGTLLLCLGYAVLRLRQSYRAINEANQNLEKKVDERTQKLSDAYTRLKQSQVQLIQSEKMASLGQMVAGVAHEINTPLGYVKSNVNLVCDMISDLEDVVEQYRKAISLMLEDDSNEQMVADELSKVVSLGSRVEREQLFSGAREALNDSDYGLEQITGLVVNLRNFSRIDRKRIEQYSVNDALDSTLKIAHNMLKSRITIKKKYGEVPKINCFPSQINQIFLNLITNSAQAIEGEGVIAIQTSLNKGFVEVSIADNGCGIPDDIKSKIFDPFYTTKDVGQGTGLGLSIVHKIVEAHKGKIKMLSRVGQGTRFVIALPVAATPLQVDGQLPDLEQAV